MGALSGILLDSNVIIDALDGVAEASALLESGGEFAISIMTWLEVLAGVRNPSREIVVRELLSGFTVVNLTPAVSEQTLSNRRNTRLKLIDAIILATAQVTGRQLYTRNTRDFDPAWPGVVVPYTIS